MRGVMLHSYVLLFAWLISYFAFVPIVHSFDRSRDQKGIHYNCGYNIGIVADYVLYLYSVLLLLPLSLLSVSTAVSRRGLTSRAKFLQARV